MEIKEYQVKFNDDRRPVLMIKHKHNIDCVYEVHDNYQKPEMITNIINQIFDVSHLAQEYVWMLCLDNAFHLKALIELSHGSMNRSLFPIREIMQNALLSGSTGIVMAHCHTSGDIEPSDIDIIITSKLQQACQIMGIELYDHIIIGCDEELPYYSFLANDLLHMSKGEKQ